MYSAVSAKVEGRVQGVGFRYSCMYECRRLGLVGWVRNTGDGGVELWAEGEERDLNELLQWLRDGPSYARVDSLLFDRQTPKNTFDKFEIKR